MTQTIQTTSTAAELVALDRAHVIHPHRPADRADSVLIVRGDGCRVWDAEGGEYLDATAGLALTQVGHGREELALAAAAQIRELEYYPSFWEYGNPRSIELAVRLVGLAPPGLEKVFFTSGGSEGIEVAMRMARLYHHERGAPERTVVLARASGYHGVGYGSGSLTGFDDYHHGFAPMLPDVRHLTPPWSCRPELFGGADATDFCVEELERVIAELGAERIAAFVGEPVMGVAGMVTPPDGYWRRVAEVLDRHGILLIADEVICAYGRTGHWFASERYGLTPDILVTAKGITSGYIPLGAVLVSGQVGEHLDRGHDGFPIGYTYTGHPTACAVALANLDIIEREGLVERSRSAGERALAELAPLAVLPAVVEVRGAGLMIGVELSRETPAGAEIGANVSRAARDEHGVIVRAHESVLSLSPPLSLSDDELTRVLGAVADVVGRLDERGEVKA
jgi:putrescine aminotransferase